MSKYQDIAGGYAYAVLRVGLSVRAPNGREVYVQPGDDTAGLLETIEALEEVDAEKRGAIADMTLGEYFA